MVKIKLITTLLLCSLCACSAKSGANGDIDLDQLFRQLDSAFANLGDCEQRSDCRTINIGCRDYYYHIDHEEGALAQRAAFEQAIADRLFLTCPAACMPGTIECRDDHCSGVAIEDQNNIPDDAICLVP